jgi:hypothetical protein
MEYPPFIELPAHPELPDPLTSFAGEKITTIDQWQTRRAPELKQLFQHYMYGVIPAPPKHVSYTVVREVSDYFGGKATLREVDVSLGVPGAPTLHLLAVVPHKPVGTASPVFVGLNFQGNHSVIDDKQIRLSTTWTPDRFPGVVDNKPTEASRGAQQDRWVLEQTIDRGYAVVTCYCGDIDPDRPDPTDGVQPYFYSSEDPDTQWGTVAAWAWGLMRLVDYVTSRDEFDHARIIAFGHSRLGKTALVATAFDGRIALGIPHQAGCGGTSPSRGTVGESVAKINTSFPHWFCGNFKKFNAEPARLPFDQHCLMALCAPRPILCSNAVEDQWANPDGQFDNLVAASPVYRLLGGEGLVPADKPPVGKLLAKKLGYFIREGKHTVTSEDWSIFCDYADAQLGRPK